VSLPQFIIPVTRDSVRLHIYIYLPISPPPQYFINYAQVRTNRVDVAARQVVEYTSTWKTVGCTMTFYRIVCCYVTFVENIPRDLCTVTGLQGLPYANSSYRLCSIIFSVRLNRYTISWKLCVRINRITKTTGISFRRMAQHTRPNDGYTVMYRRSLRVE
jgi:hypothetical protein